MKVSVTIGLSVVVLLIVTLACSLSVGNIEIDSIRGDGDLVEQERQVSGIKSVRVANQGNLTIELGEQESLVIEAERNLLEYLESEVRGGELVLETRGGVNLRNTEPIRYTLTVRELEEINVSSSGNVVAPEFVTGGFTVRVSSSGNVSLEGLTVEDLQVSISSSGDVSIDALAAERIRVNISSSGNLVISAGEVVDQDITISSSGNYEAGGLRSRRADVALTSSGSATIRVSDELTARLTSSGDLFYIGSPTIEARESSSGDVIQVSE